MNRRDEHGNVYGDEQVIDNVFVNGKLISSRVRGGAVTVKSYNIGPDGKPRPAEPRPASPRPEPEAVVKTKRSTAPRWRGCVPASVFAGLLIWLIIPTATLGLMGLSVLGTFYGARGIEVPILTPLQILVDIRAAPWVFGLALLAQGALSVAQYGCPELAGDDRRWWIGYGLALGLSIWFNWVGYAPVLLSIGVPWAVAIGAVIIGDVVPEIAAKRR